MYFIYYDFCSHVPSTVCLVIPHCRAMFSNSNPPPSCWIVDWTPRPFSTFCPSHLFTGGTLPFASALVLWVYQLSVWQYISLLFSLYLFSPRLSKLPGWVSKDGTINLEKVREVWPACLTLSTILACDLFYCCNKVTKHRINFVFSGAQRMCRTSVCGLTARVLSPRGTKIHSCYAQLHLTVVMNPGAA